MQHFYHVLIRTSEDEKLRCIFSDLSLDALRAKFLKPYLKGARILCDSSSVIDATRVIQIKISKTSQNAETELLALRKRSRDHIDELNREPSGVVFLTLGQGWSNDELGELGADVTVDHLQGRGPGEGQSRVVEFLNNNWVLLIVGVLLAAGLAVLTSHYGLT